MDNSLSYPQAPQVLLLLRYNMSGNLTTTHLVFEVCAFVGVIQVLSKSGSDNTTLVLIYAQGGSQISEQWF